MNEWVVVDASVIVKAFVSEVGSEAAGRLWSSDILLVAPAHALAEVGEALRRKRAREEITGAQLQEAARALPGTVLPIGLAALFEAAMTVAMQLSLSFYDALYVAAAERWDCQLVTADERIISTTANSQWSGKILKLEDYGSAKVE
jgi:predicted nucleic acid-binding protein